METRIPILSKDAAKERLMQLVQQIKDNDLRLAVAHYMEHVVEPYFWEVPASSSGKYHPDYALGEGGLVRHTIAAATFALEMFEISKFQEQWERDVLLAAVIMHDTMKQGRPCTGHTTFDHPIVASDAWTEFAAGITDLNPQYVEMIAKCIASHMGKWNTSKYSPVILPVPVTRYEKYVHICDYLASRKKIAVSL